MLILYLASAAYAWISLACLYFTCPVYSCMWIFVMWSKLPISTIIHIPKHLPYPFQFSDFDLSFSHAAWVMLSIDSADLHGFPHWRDTKCVGEIALKNNVIKDNCSTLKLLINQLGFWSQTCCPGMCIGWRLEGKVTFDMGKVFAVYRLSDVLISCARLCRLVQGCAGCTSLSQLVAL